VAQRLSASERERIGQELYALRGAALSVAARVLGESSLAEDVCAESYLRAVKSIESLTSLAELRSWFLRVVVNTARSQGSSETARRRREERVMRERGSSDQVGPLEEIAGRELAEVSSTELQQLEEKQRLALSLHYEQGLTHSEVARALDLPVGTASSDISRGLEDLRARLRARGVTVAPAVVVGALAAGRGATVPAGLSTAIKGSLSAGLGIKAATLGATAAAGGVALIWKIVAGLAVASLAGLGAWGGARSGGPKPAKPNAKEPSAAPKTTRGALAKPVTLAVKKARFRDVLRNVYKQTGLRWASPPMRLMPPRPITLDVRMASADAVMEALARQTGFTWRRGPDGVAIFNVTAADLAERLAALKAAAGQDEIARAEAVDQLGKAGDLRVLPYLARAVEDESALVRAWAAEGLKRYMVDPPRTDYRRRPLSSDGRVYNLAHYWMTQKERKALVAALLRAGIFSKAVIKQYGGDCCPGEEARLRLLASLDDDGRAMKAILEALDSDKEIVLSMAVGAAALSAREDYLQKLLPLGQGGDKKRAVLAAGALRRFASEKAQKCWLEVSLTKRAAINHIVNSITPEDTWAIDRLLKAFKEGKPVMKREAAGALAKLASTERDAEISKALGEGYKAAGKGWRSNHLLVAQAGFGRPEGRKALLHGLARPLHGLDLCQKLGAVARWPRPDEKLEAEVLKLVRSKNPKYSAVRRSARRALPAVGGTKTVAFFKELALARHEPTKMVRMPPPSRNEVSMWGHAGYQAVRALRKMKSKGAEAALGEIAGKTEDKILKTQLRLDRVATLPPKEAAAELLKLAEEAVALDPKTPQVSHIAIYRAAILVGELGGAEVAAALRKMAGGRHPAVRYWAAVGMGVYPGSPFKAELLKLAVDEEENVFKAACSALLRGDNWALLAESKMGIDPRVRANMIKAVKGRRGLAWRIKGASKYLAKFAKMAEAAGAEGEAARHVLGAMWSPRAVSWKIRELKSADAKRRRAAYSSMRWVRSLDPRVLPALDAYRKAHLEDIKRSKPRPRPQPEPEVF
jgi:RNA polymerase sigma-70 factor, ECF subfamily